MPSPSPRTLLKQALNSGFDKKETYALLQKHRYQKGEIGMLLVSSGVYFGESNKEKLRKEYLQELSLE